VTYWTSWKTPRKICYYTTSRRYFWAHRWRTWIEAKKVVSVKTLTLTKTSFSYYWVKTTVTKPTICTKVITYKTTVTG